ncbi:secretory component protein-like protein shr3, partial [Aureobasidium melanogenum]
MPATSSPFATFLIVGPTCFFLGVLFASFPYDYNILWTTPPSLVPGLDPREPYYQMLEDHLKFIHASPPLISRILHIVIGTGLLGFITKLYRPSEANLLFDGASLVLYMCGVTVYIANIVKGMRVVTSGIYGNPALVEGQVDDSGDYLGREDSLKVLAASDTILALLLVGVLVLQAGQWYANKKEADEIEEMDKKHDEKKALQKEHKEKKKQ